MDKKKLLKSGAPLSCGLYSQYVCLGCQGTKDRIPVEAKHKNLCSVFRVIKSDGLILKKETLENMSQHFILLRGKLRADKNKSYEQIVLTFLDNSYKF